jgi:hypothetical protein
VLIVLPSGRSGGVLLRCAGSALTGDCASVCDIGVFSIVSIWCIMVYNCVYYCV